jgi:2,3-bisphosphoglycerate-dependent phosphoglycerate mutase
MELLVIRHGLPERVERTDGTAADPDLSEAGREQAQRLADYLASEQIDAVYASPMRRAQQTALPLAAARGLAIRTEPRIAEWDRHSPTYIPLEQLKIHDPDGYRRLMRGELDLDVDINEFQRHVVDAMEEIIAEHKGQTVAVVCHGGVINTYADAVIGVGKPFGFTNTTYTSVNRFRAASSGERSIVSLNEVGHIYGTPLLFR